METTGHYSLNAQLAQRPDEAGEYVGYVFSERYPEPFAILALFVPEKAR